MSTEFGKVHQTMAQTKRETSSRRLFSKLSNISSGLYYINRLSTQIPAKTKDQTNTHVKGSLGEEEAFRNLYRTITREYASEDKEI